MRAVITGGAGFIGCNLANSLIESGQAVTLFDNLSRQHSAMNLEWLRRRHESRFTFIHGDVRDSDAVHRAIAGARFIFHCAGQTAVTASLAHPRQDLEINLLGTFNVLEAARAAGDDPIVLLASTNKVYGAMEGEPVIERASRYEFARLRDGVPETHPLDFHSPYGCSKGAADQYVRDYHRIYGLRTIVFRQSCVYGPRQMGVEEQGWISWFVNAAEADAPITIYGNGKQLRDVLYIDDLVRAYRAAVDRIDVTAGQVYNIGGGPENVISVWTEFGPLLTRLLGREIPPASFRERRVGDQPVFVCDIRKARRDFGWQPRVGTEQGVGRLIEWVRTNRVLSVEAFESLHAKGATLRACGY
jgi:CDP-paratose 2-epimerase